MNARILRKWSIHTKNLMSCSVCSLVVVVLLLFVTCAPSLILATMNFRSDASFAANPTHMPKNVIKEATLSSSSSSSTILTSLLSSSLPNRNHRLASYGRMEVVKTPDSDRESFPGYYKNYHTDDTQPLSPQQIGYIRKINGGSSSSYSSRNRELMSANSKSRHKFIENKQQLHNINDNLDFMLQPQGWPRHHLPTSQQLSPLDVDDSLNDGIKHLYTDGIYDEYEAENDKDASERKIMHAKIPSSSPDRYSTTTTTMTSSHNFPVQQHSYNSRREAENRTHHVAPPPHLLPLQPKSSTKTLSQLQRTSRTASALAPALASTASISAHLKQPELINNSNFNKFRNVTNMKNIFSTEHNKSVVQVPAPVLKENNIDNSNVNKIKSSLLPLRFIIESYEVPASLPLKRELTEQQRRMLIHEQHLRQLRTMQQQAARSRRDSLRNRYKKYQNDLQTASSFSSLSSTAAASAASSASSASPSSTSLLAATKNLRKTPLFHNLRQHQHQHHHQQPQQQQRMRKHSRRYCSARDPAQLAFEAPTVFEGKIVSMTPDRRQNFSATVEVREVFKQQIGYRLQKYLRLQFAYRNNSGECDIYREELRARGLIRGDTIEPGRLYFLFVQQIDIGNFTILGQPIRKTKRVVEAVRYAVSGNYAQLASIKSISASNRSVENGQELRIICKVTGRPPPKVTWFKDHRSINRNRKLYQFLHYKKRSELIIRSFNTSDAGRYECRAKNKVNRNIERRAIVIKAYPVQRFDPNPRGAGNNCPDDASEFCFNGGTCKFFSEIGSYSCICPEGFIGERCDRKEVNNMPPSTYSNEHECGENKYLGSYYC